MRGGMAAWAARAACAVAVAGCVAGESAFDMAGFLQPRPGKVAAASSLAAPAAEASTWRWGQAASAEPVVGTGVAQGDDVDHGIYVEGSCSSAACLAAENHLLRKKLFALRQDLGNLSCIVNHIGPTGGFCLSKDAAHVGGNDFIDTALADKFVSLFAHNSVLDLGCGLGQYGRYFDKKGANITWKGYDGAENVVDVTNGYVHWADLTVPQWLGKEYDWVLSLEVAEHIPSELEAAFLSNLVRHARYGVVLSWAVPGQDGHHHVNCKNNADATLVMMGLGMEPDPAMTAYLQKTAQIPWLKNTVMVFWKPEARASFKLPRDLPSSHAMTGIPLLAARVRSAWQDLLTAANGLPSLVQGLTMDTDDSAVAARRTWQG